MTVDLWQVYATVLRGWLGLDGVPILAAEWETLPLLL
jgi:hypothetical protein